MTRGGPKPRDRRGRFRRLRGVTVTAKGYARYTSGPHRHQYVHRVVAERMLKRKLSKDEDVHHRDGNKLNNHPRNLEVTGHREHGAVSALQHWFFVNILEPKLKGEWDEYFNEEERKKW